MKKMEENSKTPGTELGRTEKGDSWNPEQYEKFREERQLPFRDLLSMINKDRAFGHAVDLGCGTGELTGVLHQHFQITHTTGVDNSPAMLSKAMGVQQKGLDFEEAQLEHWQPPHGVDLIFSNAALQWVPDHHALLGHLGKYLKVGGQIAVQIPANHDHVSHVLAAQIAKEEPFRTALGGYTRQSPVLGAEDYAVLLYRLGLRNIRCEMRVYGHILASSREVVEWVKGTLLTDYQGRLPAEMFASFLRIYTERLVGILGEERPYFYPFKRILFRASKVGT